MIVLKIILAIIGYILGWGLVLVMLLSLYPLGIMAIDEMMEKLNKLDENKKKEE